MKISILLPDLRGGGVERVRITLAHEFTKLGHTVEFVLLSKEGELLHEAETSFRVQSLECARLRSVPYRLIKYLKDYTPDVLLAAMWPLTGIASLAVFITGKRTRLVMSEHNDFKYNPSLTKVERIALKYFGRWIYSRHHGIVTVSFGVSESLQEAAGVLPANIQVINNPLRYLAEDTLQEEDRKKISDWLKSEMRLIAIGSLKSQKGFDDLIKVMAEIRKSCDASLLILGEGKLRASLKMLISEHQLEKDVVLLGFQHNPMPFLKLADLFVLSSKWEGFGNVIVEALSVGLPVVSTDCPSGPAEILDNGKYGKLVPVSDILAIKEAILSTQLPYPEPEKLIRRALEFSPTNIAKKYIAIMKNGSKA